MNNKNHKLNILKIFIINNKIYHSHIKNKYQKSEFI